MRAERAQVGTVCHRRPQRPKYDDAEEGEEETGAIDAEVDLVQGLEMAFPRSSCDEKREGRDS